MTHIEQLALSLAHGNAVAVRLAALRAATHLPSGQGGVQLVPRFTQRVAVHHLIKLGVVSFRRAGGLGGELDQAVC